MKAAVINSFSAPPQYGTFSEPVSGQGETIITVSAAALSPLVKGQASGKHYSSKADFPFVPGVDGVGKLPDGTRVYFAFPQHPFGTMAERAAIRNPLYVPVPDGIDDVTAAAIANPGMSSWAALTARAKLVPGETVLINGATGCAGRLAIQIAKHMGAKKVIATGRNPERLRTLSALGADVVLSLELPEEELSQRFAQEIGAGVNVVLDYLWGRSAELLIGAVSDDGSHRENSRLRFVQIGSISGPTIALPGSALRSAELELMGSGIGSVSREDLLGAIGALLKAVVPAKLQIDAEAVPLTDVETAWNQETGERRLVFTL